MRLFAIAALTASLALGSGAMARDYQAGAVKILAPWAKASLPGMPNGAGFLVLRNDGKAADRLISLSSPAAARTEIHEMSMTGGVMRMRRLSGGIALPPGKSVELRPGAEHIMLIGLKSTLKPGQKVPATLVFEKAGKVVVEFEVRPVAPVKGHMSGHSH